MELTNIVLEYLKVVLNWPFLTVTSFIVFMLIFKVEIKEFLKKDMKFRGFEAQSAQGNLKEIEESDTKQQQEESVIPKTPDTSIELIC
jgi:hypothetical protein